MPHEECVQIGLAAVEKVSLHEREESRQNQKYDDKNVRHRRREITAEFALRDGFDIGESRAHGCSFRKELCGRSSVWSSSFSSCGVNQKIEHEPGQLSRAQ